MAAKTTARAPDAGLIEVTVVLLERALPSSSVAPIEIFSTAGVLWQRLHGQAPTPRFHVRTVSLDGRAVKSCTVLAVQADGAKVVTIEGLPGDGGLHPLQEAFWEHHGLQCGFCTPGMIMSASELIAAGPLDEDAIRHGLEGNLCRCTGYENIVKAVAAAAGGR